MKKIYFAHPVNTYGKPIEKEFIKYIKTVFDDNENKYEIINPNGEIHQLGYKEKGIDYFKEIVQTCDILCAFPFEDNSIGAGIHKEIMWAHEKNIPIFICNYKFFLNPIYNIEQLEHTKILTVEETRAKLKS